MVIMCKHAAGRLQLSAHLCDSRMKKDYSYLGGLSKITNSGCPKIQATRSLKVDILLV
jgi:hypothetical protein